MKTFITFLLFASGIACFGQPSPKKEDPGLEIVKKGGSVVTIIDDSNDLSFAFDALNGAIIQEAINVDRYKIKTDSARRELVIRMLTINKVDFSRISEKGDSLKVSPNGIELILKPNKKK